MRETLFRGKVKPRLPNRYGMSEWVEGDLVHDTGGNPCIMEMSNEETITYHVDPETVGIWSGLRDQNGKRIFEGDVVSYLDVFRKPQTGKIIWNEGFCRIGLVSPSGVECSIPEWGEGLSLEVTGNIYGGKN